MESVCGPSDNLPDRLPERLLESSDTKPSQENHQQQSQAGIPNKRMERNLAAHGHPKGPVAPYTQSNSELVRLRSTAFCAWSQNRPNTNFHKASSHSHLASPPSPPYSSSQTPTPASTHPAKSDPPHHAKTDSAPNSATNSAPAGPGPHWRSAYETAGSPRTSARRRRPNCTHEASYPPPRTPARS